MPETLATPYVAQPVEALPEAAQLSPESQAAHAAFSNSLEALSVNVPEIAGRRDELFTAGNEVIDALGVKPEFFDKHDHALLFASIAANLADVNKMQPGPDNYDKKNYLANATFLLTLEDADGHTALKERHLTQDESDEVSDDHAAAIYQKYTDGPASAKLIEKIDKAGYLDEVADKLGVTAKPTEEVKIRVLNIGQPGGGYSFKKQENGLEYSEVNAWAKGLSDNAEEFARDMIDSSAKLAAGAAGFAVELHGKPEFMIPREKAEAVLAADDGVHIQEGIDASRVVGTLRHEFAHTHGNTRIAKHFGFAIEERRAEHFGGDTGEYYDVKQMFNELALLKGVHVKDMFDKVAEAQKRGEDASIYDELANAYGLDVLVNVATAVPRPYVPYFKSEFVKDMYRSGPKMEGEIAGFVAAKMTDEEKQIAAKRILETVSKVAANNVTPDFLMDYYAKIATHTGISREQLFEAANTAEKQAK
ncbi:MAG TPA: hypothetical protein VFI84_01570 [Candidatus Saccharimonadales bacterium]|nr:hypothetical protein [Candidatus Saccharimonadales bacterium]